MARRASPWVELRVGTTAPSGAPTTDELIADRAPDEWDLRYEADSAAVTLSATSVAPAQLWGWSGRWMQLESAYQVAARTIADGDGLEDKVPRAANGFSALAVVYSAGITNAANLTARVRTVRSQEE